MFLKIFIVTTPYYGYRETITHSWAWEYKFTQSTPLPASVWLKTVFALAYSGEICANWYNKGAYFRSSLEAVLRLTNKRVGMTLVKIKLKLGLSP